MKSISKYEYLKIFREDPNDWRVFGMSWAMNYYLRDEQEMIKHFEKIETEQKEQHDNQP